MKLDRVLTALEGLSRPTADQPKLAEKSADKPASTIYAYPPGVTQSAAVPFKPDGNVTYYTAVPVDPIKMPQGGQQASGVEQRLAELERRLSKLEKHVYEGVGSNTVRGQGASTSSDGPFITIPAAQPKK